MRPETYMALKPGAVPTDIPGIASTIQEFYTKEPVLAMKEMTEGLSKSLMESGMAQSDAFMLMSTSGPLAEFGKMGPAAFQALTSLSEQQIKEAGAAGNMSKLAELAAQHFPDQAKNLEGLREAQIVLGDPLKVIQRAIIRIFRLLVAAPLLTLGRGAVLTQGTEAEKYWNTMESPPTKQISKTPIRPGV
jgi:hypothetical protein